MSKIYQFFSLIGGIQPARLVQLQGLTSDGLLQRLLPIMLMPGKLALDQPSDDEGYRELIIALIEAKQQQLEPKGGGLKVRRATYIPARLRNEASPPDSLPDLIPLSESSLASLERWRLSS